MDQQSPPAPIGSHCSGPMKKELAYEFLDSGNGKKLERFGPYLLARPCSQALWKPSLPELWKQADASFDRENKIGWKQRDNLPQQWEIEIEHLLFKISTTDFGHLGIFPEHAPFWPRMEQFITEAKRQISVLNLFAYSGGATLAAAKAGAKVCHVDASKGMISWAKENAALNHLTEKPIRWIADDAIKFMKREIRRGQTYDAIIIDPPTFGRGTQGEVFKIEEEIQPLLEMTIQLLSLHPLFILFTCHTPGFTPLVMQHLLEQHIKTGKLENEEMQIHGKNTLPLPSGSYVLWKAP